MSSARRWRKFLPMADVPRDILLFVASYEERSFTAAAARENATQSGVSQHIRKLEERFGARLFNRDGGRVAPTPAADRYYRHCIDILRAYETAAQSLRQQTGLEGEVAVGLMPTMTRCCLAPALDSFLGRHSNVTIRIVEGYSRVLTDLVRAGELDFAVVPAFPDASGLTCREFATTPEVLVSSARSQVDLHAADGVHLVVPERQNTRRQTIETYIAINGINVTRLLELDSMLGTLDLVSTSGWITILPGVMMARDRLQPGRFTISPLHRPPLTLGLVSIKARRRSLPLAAQAFHDGLQEVTHRQNAVWADPGSFDGPDYAVPPCGHTAGARP